MDASDFIEKGSKSRRQPVYVLTGDEDFLKRRALSTLQDLVLGDADPTLALSIYPGDKADFSTIRNELETLPFLSERRMVLVEQADPFVTKFRSQLEKYVAEPSSIGVLVLDVKSWSSNTKLAKAIPPLATLECKAPAAYRLPAWCIDWAATKYDKKLAKPAAELLVELVGPLMGILDQELQKLSDYVGTSSSIDIKDVDLLVGRSHTRSVFKILDAIGDGQPKEALNILAGLFEKGEDSLKVLGALGHQLRKLVQVARGYERTKNLETAMDQAGIAKWPQAREATRKQLKHLGSERLYALYDWLIELDLGMKGDNPLPAEVQLERLLVTLSRNRS